MAGSSRKKKTIYLFVGIFVALVVFRIFLPVILKNSINKTLGSSLEHYVASIEDLDLSLLTGSYFIEGLVVRKRAANQKTPFIRINEIEVNISWQMIFKGKLVLDVIGQGTRVQLVDGEDNEKNEPQTNLQKESASNWTDALDAVVPLSIQSIRFNDTTLNFSNKKIKGFETFRLNLAVVEIEHLTDPNFLKNNLSPFLVKGDFADDTPFGLDGGIDLTLQEPRFDINFKLSSFDLQKVNRLLRYYVPLDISTGSLTVFAEMTGSMKNAEGYARVFADDLDIVELGQQYQSGRHFLFEWVGGFANWILQVITDGAIATEIPLKISNEETEVDSGTAIWKTLENAADKIPRRFK